MAGLMVCALYLFLVCSFVWHKFDDIYLILAKTNQLINAACGHRTGSNISGVECYMASEEEEKGTLYACCCEPKAKS